ncbi:MAG: transposase, partial [Flavobacteriaceae bacterium]|nr:transposase [Flavobacteriaceae bacterium]
ISYQTIKKELQTSEPTISFWRQRWYNNQDKLQTFIAGIDNQNVTDNDIKKEILTILDDAPRSGAPAEFTDEIQKKIMAVACESPQQYELPFSHWTHKELAKQVIKLGIVDSISAGHLGRLLKKNKLSPHKSKYWIYPKIDDFQDFSNSVDELCKIYKSVSVPEENQKGKIEYHCSDEKTGMQALERKTEPMKSGSVEKTEPEYTRHGTQTLIASRSVKTGKIDSYTVGDTRKEEDYLEHTKGIFETDINSKHVIICDQLNTHKSASLVEYIAGMENIDYDLGIKGKTGILKSMNSRMEFLENKEHKISFVYLPKHTSWLNQIENWFGLLERRVLKRGIFISKDDLKQKIIDFIEYYNKYYAKPYVWKKTANA